MMKYQTRMIFGVVVMLMLLALGIPVQADSSLPPRGTPPHSSPGDDHHDDHAGPPAGAIIELQVTPGRPGDWAAVEWQDEAGGWREVDGWRGQLDTAGRVRWWVHPKDFGKGLFRWTLVGSQLSTEPFTLPVQPNQVMQLELAVTATPQ